MLTQHPTPLTLQLIQENNKKTTMNLIISLLATAWLSTTVLVRVCELIIPARCWPEHMWFGFTSQFSWYRSTKL